MNTIFKNQKDMLDELKRLIDGYWENEITEEVLFNKIKVIKERNKTYLFEEGSEELASTVKIRLGKKRLRILDQIFDK